MAPGEGVRRGMRVREFIRQKGIQECGGKPGPVDSTANRYGQDSYPDLELIRERGFSEPEAARQEDEQLERLGSSCKNLYPDIPGFDQWWGPLQGAWEETVRAALQDSSLNPLKPPMAKCLTEKSGLAADPADPAVSFLRSVNLAMSAPGKAPEKVFAAAYADCGKPYFDRVRELLLERRPAMVERNREVIETFAKGLVAAGYVP